MDIHVAYIQPSIDVVSISTLILQTSGPPADIPSPTVEPIDESVWD